MIEVKLSPEESKAGADPEDCAGLIDAIRRMSESAAHRPDDDAALVRRCGAFTTILPDAARTRAIASGCRNCRWACLMISRSRLKKARRMSAWVRLFSANDESRDGRILLSASPCAHRCGGL